MEQEYIAGLDIGTTKICTVIGRLSDDGDIDIVGMGIVPARGLSKGAIVDLRKATSAVQKSVEKASYAAGIAIDDALIGVTGSFVKTQNVHGAVAVSEFSQEPATVDDAVLMRVFESAVSNIPQERKIIHLSPQRFILDGQEVISPWGMIASRLELNAHLVTATSGAVANMTNCAAGAGIEAQALVLEPIATAFAVTSADERALGVGIIDIGGGTSDIAVFRNGVLQMSSVIPAGGNHVTQDISVGLSTPFDDAETLKIEYGTLSHLRRGTDVSFEVISADGRRRKLISRSTLHKIIKPRMMELFEIARDRMKGHLSRNRLPAGIILTGGGVLLPGVAELARQILGIPVRISRANESIRSADSIDSPKLSTALGLLLYARQMQQDDYVVAELPHHGNAESRVWGVPLNSATIAAQNGYPESEQTPYNTDEELSFEEKSDIARQADSLFAWCRKAVANLWGRPE